MEIDAPRGLYAVFGGKRDLNSYADEAQVHESTACTGDLRFLARLRKW
jgi:hypothetical protein